MRAHIPGDPERLRAEIAELLPRVSDRSKAEKALREWAGNDPARLAQLLDKIRSKVAIEETARASAPVAPDAEVDDSGGPPEQYND